MQGRTGALARAFSTACPGTSCRSTAGRAAALHPVLQQVGKLVDAGSSSSKSLGCLLAEFRYDTIVHVGNRRLHFTASLVCQIAKLTFPILSLRHMLISRAVVGRTRGALPQYSGLEGVCAMASCSVQQLTCRIGKRTEGIG